MPKIKYFQPVADIKNHYVDILRAFEDKNNGKDTLKDWLIKEVDFENIKQEADVVRYLLACQHGFSMYGEDLKKPTLEAVNRCFSRHLAFLNHVFNVNSGTYKLREIKEFYPTVVKEYIACLYYLEKFSDESWLKKMPDEVLTIQSRLRRKAEKKKLKKKQ